MSFQGVTDASLLITFYLIIKVGGQQRRNFQIQPLVLATTNEYGIPNKKIRPTENVNNLSCPWHTVHSEHHVTTVEFS